MSTFPSLPQVIGCEEPGLVEGLRAAEFLVVVGAGNNYNLVQSACVYPPALSEFRDRMIVVGAHDWELSPADFSNYGPLVDLLAPGCAIPISG